MDCIFCKIAAKQIPSSVVFENDMVLAFRDIQPEAPSHVLVIPKKHVASLDDLAPEEQELAAALLFAVQEVARLEKVAESGYRVVTNTGKEGGQTVSHLHFHVLGGRNMQWPPG